MKATTSILSRGQHPGGALGFWMAQCGVPMVLTSAHLSGIVEWVQPTVAARLGIRLPEDEELRVLMTAQVMPSMHGSVINMIVL